MVAPWFSTLQKHTTVSSSDAKYVTQYMLHRDLSQVILASPVHPSYPSSCPGRNESSEPGPALSTRQLAVTQFSELTQV